MRRRSFHLPAVRRAKLAAPAVAAVVLVLAPACGSPSGETAQRDGVASATGKKSGPSDAAGRGNSKSDDPQQAALDFARCMREHGVEMPDPTFEEQGRTRIIVGTPAAPGQEQEIDEQAHQACKRYLEEGMGDGPGKPDPKMQEQALAYARCMRDHGVDLPDPQFSEDGGGLAFMIGDGADPTSPLFREAEKACQQFFGPGYDGPGSGSGSGPAPAPASAPRST